MFIISTIISLYAKKSVCEAINIKKNEKIFQIPHSETSVKTLITDRPPDKSRAFNPCIRRLSGGRSRGIYIVFSLENTVFCLPPS
jgi:hypothetical protein